MRVLLAIGVVVEAGSCAPPDIETKTSAIAGQGVQIPWTKLCPVGYPQRVCQTGQVKPVLQVTCVCFPPDVNTSDDMAYQVVTIVHAPPGNMSSLSYPSGSTVGTVEQVTNTTQLGFDLDLSVSTPGGGADSESKWLMGKVSGHQNLVQTINTDTIGIVQTQDIPSHAYDVFYLWLNPTLTAHQSGITGRLSAQVGPSSFMWSPAGQRVSSVGPDGLAKMQVVAITGNALANPAARTPAEQGFVGHLTPAQIADILALDDFYGNDSFDPAQYPSLYRYVTTLDLSGPEPGSPIVTNDGKTIEYDSQNDHIDGSAQHAESTVRAGPKFGKDDALSFSAQFGAAWTWDYNDTRTDIQGTQKAASVVLQSSTPCLHASVDMYLDLTFGTWVAKPTFTNYSCAFYDPPHFSGLPPTTCNVGGTVMHCCPAGSAMVGVHLDSNTFKCAPLRNPNGAVTLDLGTVRNNMHVCPFGQVMVGLHTDLNRLACQSIPGNPITSERVDSSTADSFPMHVCDSTFLTEAMSGIRADQNLLTCATNPQVF
jgi:hypothetical protein